jgi:hypothetical protein
MGLPSLRPNPQLMDKTYIIGTYTLNLPEGGGTILYQDKLSRFARTMGKIMFYFIFYVLYTPIYFSAR